MGLEELTTKSPASIFSDEDRIMHTTKMVERTFGVEASQIGEIVMKDDRAVLNFNYKGTQHTLRWERTGRGGIVWFVDDSTQGIVLGEPGRAMQRLVTALGG
jgi:hypothetical protein